MVLLPLFERLTTYLLGIAGWCLLLGQDNPIRIDLTPAGGIALGSCLFCIPLVLWLHRRESRGRHVREAGGPGVPGTR